MVHREPGHDDRERAVGIGQGGDVFLSPADVGEPFFDRERAGAVEHRRRHVDTGRVPDVRGEGANYDAAAAGDVEHSVVGTGAAASTITCSAAASVIGFAVLNGIAWRVNWSRISRLCELFGIGTVSPLYWGGVAYIGAASRRSF